MLFKVFLRVSAFLFKEIAHRYNQWKEFIKTSFIQQVPTDGWELRKSNSSVTDYGVNLRPWNEWRNIFVLNCISEAFHYVHFNDFQKFLSFVPLNEFLSDNYLANLFIFFINPGKLCSLSSYIISSFFAEYRKSEGYFLGPNFWMNSFWLSCNITTFFLSFKPMPYLFINGFIFSALSSVIK